MRTRLRSFDFKSGGAAREDFAHEILRLAVHREEQAAEIFADQSHDDEFLNAVFLELQIQIRIGETTGAPVLRGYYITRLRFEPGADLAAPGCGYDLGRALRLRDRKLPRRGVLGDRSCKVAVTSA